MSKVLVELALDPIGTDTTSESDFIVAAERILRQSVSSGSEIQYQIGPMSTTIEGELYQVLSIVGQMHEAAFVEGPNGSSAPSALMTGAIANLTFTTRLR